MSSTNDKSNEPVHVVRAGGISVAIFANELDDHVFYKLSAQRVYKSGKEFKTSHSFGLGEIPTLVLLMLRAWSYATELENKAKERDND